MERRLPIIKKIRPGGHLLDIGANDGTFLKHAIEHGFEATGIELAPAMARFASRYAHTEVWGGSTDSFIENHHDRTFDIASLWDVIEHFLDPLAELKKINGLLNPGGLLAISTVNRGSLRGKMYGDRWLGFFEGQEHTFFFTPEVMCRYMQSAGFRVVKVLGWNTPPLLLRFVDLFKLGNILEVYAVKE